jgi:hypothetical protein
MHRLMMHRCFHALHAQNTSRSSQLLCVEGSDVARKGKEDHTSHLIPHTGACELSDAGWFSGLLWSDLIWCGLLCARNVNTVRESRVK